MTRIILIVALAVALLYIGLRERRPILETYKAVEIAELVKDPLEFDGRRVTVSGIVGYNAAVMGVGGYLLKRGDAEILILSAQGIPPAGSQVSLSGTFRQALALNGFEYAVIFQE